MESFQAKAFRILCVLGTLLGSFCFDLSDTQAMDRKTGFYIQLLPIGGGPVFGDNGSSGSISINFSLGYDISSQFTAEAGYELMLSGEPYDGGGRSFYGRGYWWPRGMKSVAPNLFVQTGLEGHDT